MTLAIFDLDNTLLDGDSDYGWGQFLVKKNYVDPVQYEAANVEFFRQYQKGELDIYEYCAFSFKPLAERSMDELQALHREFMETIVRPMITQKARDLVEQHRQQGHILLVMTSTNSFITRPIALEFGIEHLLATEPKIIDGRYTTEVDGIPCFHEGKVKRLELWLRSTGYSLSGSWFYSDSMNDLPLLEKVDHAVAVDPDEKLAQVAKKRGWKIISLR